MSILRDDEPYVNIDPTMVVENGDLRIIGWDVSVELILIEKPLDWVQVVSLHVVVAAHYHLIALDRVRRDHRVFHQFDAFADCKEKSPWIINFLVLPSKP